MAEQQNPLEAIAQQMAQMMQAINNLTAKQAQYENQIHNRASTSQATDNGDASKYALGAVLSQINDNKDHPVAFASRTLYKHEINYSTTEKKALAIIWAIDKFNTYLHAFLFSLIQSNKIVTRNTYTKYITFYNLRDALKSQLTTPVLRDAIEVAIVNLAAVYIDAEFIKLLCAVDMFFAMFPKHKLTKLRFGTLILSYKDCTGVAAIGHGCELMSHNTRIFTRWLMTPTLRQDFNRMNIPGQEITLPYSYGPYLSGLGLVDKSPYSAALDCGLHMFSHLIGCALLSTRSINAIFFQPSGLSSVIDNAILFIYAHSCTSSLQLQFFKKSEIDTVKGIENEARRQIESLRKQLRSLEDAEVASADGEAGGVDPEAEPIQDNTGLGGAGDLDNVEDAGDFDDLYPEEPRSRDALDWYAYIAKYCRGAIPERMRAVAYDRWSQIKDVRPGTVGEFAKRMGRAQTH
ncbi:uncharacterized protein LOC134207592 [Armigeres subalbatus]|uniref:uncharacterized protein LOC134207592 n=1 Tax=Armigeres subalbatus TaxID=124917 RepID=UPI002ED21D6D